MIISCFMRIALGLLLGVSILAAQHTQEDTHNTPDAHFAAAKAAAGEDFENLLQFQCYGPGPADPRVAPRGAPRAGGPRPSGPPEPLHTWHAEPVKAFDNLYFFGQSGIRRVEPSQHLKASLFWTPSLTIRSKTR